ncbi:Ser-Thr-rich glycosyl-phosphatidyl-inositol-anchored membrane family-domain-containing protein [Aspergillus multicolor]|uniref:GPI anchored serine-threonine rich family protein n=1 Tax=Aspergillus multicolor TaxID=41759 RepID=UPI003CCD4973
MRSFTRLALPAALLASLASAISITEPTANSTFAAGSAITVNWITVDTDPSTFSLYLWNFVSWPPSYVPLATNISTDEESHTVQIPCDTNPEWGYQLSAINGTNVYIIYAQGAKFSVGAPVDGESCVDTPAVPVPSTTPSPSPSASTCDATTVYVTVSPTPGSSGHHHHDHDHPSHAFSSPSLSTPTAASSSTKYTKPGLVPKTIGWQSDYEHPVTLDNPPVPTPAPEEGEASTGKPVHVVTVTTTVGVPAPAGDDRCPAP